MERFTKVLLSLTLFLMVFTLDAKGARTIKSMDAVDRPQDFISGFSIPGFIGSFPSPGSTGSFRGPGFIGPFPNPAGGSTGLSFPNPGFTESFPSPGFTGSFPSPGIGTFCPIPGVCTPARATVPGGGSDSP